MLTIGRLSRHFGLSAKTLRHYEQEGVFRPARIDALTGYRYYAPEQIPRLAEIVRLRRVGVPLEALRQLESGPESGRAQRLKTCLQAHLQRLEAEQHHVLAALAATRALLETPDERHTLIMDARIVEHPAFRLVGLELEDGRLESIGALWGRFMARCHEIAGDEPDVAYGACMGHPGGDFRYLAAARVPEGAPVPPGMVAWDLPAQKYAVFLHRGPYVDMSATFARIYERGLAQNGLVAAEGIDLERYEYARCPIPDGPDTEVDLYVPVA